MRAEVVGWTTTPKSKERQVPPRRNRTQVLIFLGQKTATIQAGKENSAKILNQMLKTESGPA